MPTFTLSQLAERFGLERRGADDVAITGLTVLSPGEPGKLAYVADSRYRAGLAGTQAAAVIVGRRDAEALVTPGLVAADVTLAFARIARLFDPRQDFEPGIHPAAFVGEGAQLGAGCRVEAGAVIEAGVVLGAGSSVGANTVIRSGAVIGAAARIEAGVVIEGGVRTGKGLHVQPGAVIGSRGFGNARLPDGSWEEIPQLGGVIIGDDVEIGANTTIDRGALGDTVIGNGVKLDNQIQIAHNCVIGDYTAIAACTGIAGSTVIGRRCMIGGAAGISGHLTICDDVVLLGRAMVIAHIDKPGVYGSGLPLAPANEWRRSVARVRHLDELVARVRQLEKKLAAPASGPSNNDDERDA